MGDNYIDMTAQPDDQQGPSPYPITIDMTVTPPREIHDIALVEDEEISLFHNQAARDLYEEAQQHWSPPRLPNVWPLTIPQTPPLRPRAVLAAESPQTPPRVARQISFSPFVNIVPETPAYLLPGRNNDIDTAFVAIEEPATPRNAFDDAVRDYNANTLFRERYFHDMEAEIQIPQPYYGEPLSCECCGSLFLYRYMSSSHCPECHIDILNNQN